MKRVIHLKRRPKLRMPLTGSIIKIFYGWHTRSNVAIVQGTRLHPKKVTKFECCQSGINFAGMKGVRLSEF